MLEKLCRLLGEALCMTISNVLKYIYNIKNIMLTFYLCSISKNRL